MLADIGGPDKQGALEQLRKFNPILYRSTNANRLGQQLGIPPQLIACWCCLVRPLTLWEDAEQFQWLVGTAAGHVALTEVANEYQALNGYWPSPAWVFEKMLGTPTTAARALQRQRKQALARDADTAPRSWHKQLMRRQVAEAAPPLAAAPPLTVAPWPPQ